MRGQGNAIPIALGVLAVVIAGSGTAVAVTATTTISAPSVPSRITVYLVQLTASGNACTTTVTRCLAVVSISSGDNVEVASPSVPLVVKPIGSASYCLGLLATTSGGVDATHYYPSFVFNGYVARGSYTGTGTAPAPAAPLPAKTAR